MAELNLYEVWGSLVLLWQSRHVPISLPEDFSSILAEVVEGSWGRGLWEGGRVFVFAFRYVILPLDFYFSRSKWAVVHPKSLG